MLLSNYSDCLSKKKSGTKYSRIKKVIKHRSKARITALDNLNFESGTFLGWDTVGQVNIDRLIPRHGRYCARLITDNPGQFASLSKRFNLSDLNRLGDSFILEFWLRVSGTSIGQLIVSFSNYPLGPGIIRFDNLPRPFNSAILPPVTATTKQGMDADPVPCYRIPVC